MQVVFVILLLNGHGIARGDIFSQTKIYSRDVYYATEQDCEDAVAVMVPPAKVDLLLACTKAILKPKE